MVDSSPLVDEVRGEYWAVVAKTWVTFAPECVGEAEVRGECRGVPPLEIRSKMKTMIEDIKLILMEFDPI